MITENLEHYGLSRYDHIVRNADKVSEQEILY